jgi:hypothetical protein
MLSLPWYIYLLQFVSGLFLANGVPHFVQGISGSWFQTPFASPRGVGDSPPTVNVLWGVLEPRRRLRPIVRFCAQGKRRDPGMGACRTGSASHGPLSRPTFRPGANETLERFLIMLNRHCADVLKLGHYRPPGLGGQARAIDNLVGRAAGEGCHISRGRLRRNGAESGLNRSNRAFPVMRLLSP